MTIIVIFAFLSGVLTILSPCILPVLPIVLSGSIGGKKRPLGIITGFILSFSIFTLVLSYIIQALNIHPDTLRTVAVIIMVVFGLVLLVPWLQNKFELITSRIINKRKQKNYGNGFFGGLLLGTTLGIVWTPCVGPIMASVISLAITQSVDGGSIFIILAYSIGTSIPMFGIMIGGRKIIEKFPLLTKNPVKLQKIFGVLIIFVAISIATGLDRKLQTAIITIFPNYGTGITAFENGELVREALDKRSGINSNSMMMSSGTAPMVWNEFPKNGKLEDFGLAPAIVAEGPWFNLEDFSGNSLTMDDLNGKVVIVDFWTYSCINCVRTIPHLKSWYEAYKGQGLVIVGVHTPEFAFEKDIDNVQQAMNDLGITWPVVLDNSYAQWYAYNNRFWPAHFFIDAEGRIRYYHFGEGEYENSEKVIRKLLLEAGMDIDEEAEYVTEVVHESRTAETYLGYARTEGFSSMENIIKDESFSYSANSSLENGEWSLNGEWIFRREYISPVNEGVLEFSFYSKDLYLVIETSDSSGWIEVYIDGEKVENTIDVIDGVLTPDKSKLYQLADLQAAGNHVVKLVVHGNLKLYAFTFG